MENMQIIAHTSLGFFKSEVIKSLTNEELLNLKKVLKEAVSVGEHFKFDTSDGFVVFGKEILRNTVFSLAKAE